MDVRRSLRWLLAACLVLLVHFHALAQSGVVRECLKRNIPKHSSSQTLELVCQHPARRERDCKARVFGTRVADGRGAGKVCMLKPPDVAGVEMLSNEVEDGPPRTRLYPPELGHAKTLAGGQLSGRVCGSDGRVLSYVGKETCVVLRSESFQSGDKLRKVMNTTADDLLSVDGDVNARSFTDESLEPRCH